MILFGRFGCPIQRHRKTACSSKSAKTKITLVISGACADKSPLCWLLLSARSRSLQNKDGVGKSEFHHRHCFIACSRVLGECCSFLLCPRYSTVAHVCKHNKQFLKQNTIFLKHNTELSKPHKINRNTTQNYRTLHKVIEAKHKITETQHKIIETQHKIIETHNTKY